MSGMPTQDELAQAYDNDTFMMTHLICEWTATKVKKGPRLLLAAAAAGINWYG
jgi:hypothetical protein